MNFLNCLTLQQLELLKIDVVEEIKKRGASFANCSDLNEEEKELVGNNKKIDAIRRYRPRTNVGLVEAKMKADEYQLSFKTH